MYGFWKKTHLNLHNIFKMISQKPTITPVMLLRTPYLRLNKPNVSKFALQRILKILSAKMISSHSLPYCCKTWQHQAQGSSFSHNQCMMSGFTNLLFRRKFIHCAMVYPFIHYYLAFFLKKGEKLPTNGENSQKTCQQASSYA